MQNISKEDYLSAIYKYRETDGTIKANRIADKLAISNAAVTDMLKKLGNDGFVDYKRYKGTRLTKNGEEYAKNMVRRHRIWEVFLHQIVGMPWDKVHEEAHNLEHGASDELINKMEEMLDFPEFDPHGDPIPDKNGSLPKQKQTTPLSLVSKGETVQVVRVNDFDNRFLKYLSGIGIELNKKLTVKNMLGFDKSMIILIDNKEVNISSIIAANVFVSRKN